MVQSSLGSRLRRLRMEKEISQTETARQLGISPSYLNLIEHNQRPVTVRLLFRIGRVFDVDIQTFSDEDEVQIGNRLRTVLADPVMRDHGISEADLDNFAASAPNVARGFLSLFAAFNAARDRVNLLQEKLSAEAILPATSHEMLSTLTSIRSISEILRDFTRMDEPRRAHFLSVLVEESEKLSSLTGRLVDVAGDTEKTDLTQFRSTIDQAADFMDRNNHFFPALEDQASAIRSLMIESEHNRDDPGTLLHDYIAKRHGLKVSKQDAETLGTANSFINQGQQEVGLLTSLTGADLHFEYACVISRLENDAIIDTLFNDAPATTVNGAREIRQQLHRYFADALLMPYEPFHAQAEENGYNIIELSETFEVPLDRAAARLTALRKPGQSGIPMHLITTDVAGSILSRQGESGMTVPLFGGVCPKWAIHGTFERPGEITGEIVTMPDGQRFHTISSTVKRPRANRFDRPERIAISIGCAEANADRLSVGAGWPIAHEANTIEGGVHCRICERQRCRQRAFPALFEQV